MLENLEDKVKERMVLQKSKKEQVERFTREKKKKTENDSIISNTKSF